jgi:zinc transport system substrate-binding protein
MHEAEYSLKSKAKIITFTLLLVSALQFAAPASASERLRVYTVNYPLQYFARRIAGEHAEVTFPAPGDVDPAFWTPDAATVGAYQGADLILLNGANYAKWIGKVSLSRRRQVNTSKSFADQYINTGSGAEHSHGTGATHAHAGVAFTTWLDLQQAVRQAESIKLAIIKKRPQLKAELESNFKKLESDLLALDSELKSALAGNREQALLASHPVYQYLARRYGLNLYSVMWEPDEYPDLANWKELVNLSRAQSAQWMIWEGKPAVESVEQLKKMGIGSIVFDPCANVPEAGDFLSVMKTNLAQLKKIRGQYTY